MYESTVSVRAAPCIPRFCIHSAYCSYDSLRLRSPQNMVGRTDDGMVSVDDKQPCIRRDFNGEQPRFPCLSRIAVFFEIPHRSLASMVEHSGEPKILISNGAPSGPRNAHSHRHLHSRHESGWLACRLSPTLRQGSSVQFRALSTKV